MAQGNPYGMVEIEMMQELHRGIEKQIAKIKPWRGLLYMATILRQRRPQIQFGTARPYNKRAYELGEC